MSKIFSTSDLNRLIKNIILEQQGEGKFTGGGMGPGGLKSNKSTYTVTLDGSLFENGVDQIDQNSSAFKKGIDSIRNAVIQSTINGSGTPSIQIVGGASAVGSNKGYDNSSLAKRRANNFYNIVKNIFPNVKFTTGAPKVGTATTKNSPEAKSEQFVKLNISGTKATLYDKPAIDHTTNKLNPEAAGKKIIPQFKTETTYIVCFELSETMYNKIKNTPAPLGGKIISAKKK